MSTTSRELWYRLWLLAALVALTTLALLGSYTGVHDGAVPLASSTAPGVLDVDTAKDALLRAEQDAELDAASDAAGTSSFSTQVAVANQILTSAAAEDVTGATGRLTLKTVTGLISAYSYWIGLAGQVPARSPLHAGYMEDAADVLGRPGDPVTGSSLMSRLNALQQAQVAVVHRQAAFGWPLALGWCVSGTLVVALAAALAEAHRFHRTRFRRRWNRQLAAAGVLLVGGAAVLGTFTWQTHSGLFHARRLLERPHAGPGISTAGADVARRMADTGFRAAAAGWIVAGGVALMVLVVWALAPRIGEYRVKVSR
ncbi:putative integral membrane protein [Actinacidiphila reveromycinica]|uniref:Putative integral membrane protein n=1 Tax=Actinacidiphila reveromycinica TaxID=659352 RepID=A0A7U3VN31_9ACTN|nr:hypothetical protein [Streptomyces sp. SN-593]BBA97228.1 putative integral membrane protein [Streptomyces sp. SN-593]